jgi:hypothetical protein
MHFFGKLNAARLAFRGSWMTLSGSPIEGLIASRPPLEQESCCCRVNSLSSWVGQLLTLQQTLLPRDMANLQRRHGDVRGYDDIVR